MAVFFFLVSAQATSWSVMRLCVLLVIFTHHTLICLSSEADELTERIGESGTLTELEPPTATNTTPPPTEPAVCVSRFLDILIHPNMTEEGEAPPASELDMDKPEEDDDVLSFSEFKEKMKTSAAEIQKFRPSSSKMIIRNITRNYASVECGAKVIGTNSNARNPEAILNSNKDQYLINDCSSPIFFIVELCELISVRSIVIASLELFSSIPKSFKVYAAERYEDEKDNEEEWVYAGTVQAANERKEQSFSLNNEEQVYAKYIKVVMESHFGQERLCPINTFKVIGASMIEVYEEFHQEEGSTPQPSVISGPDSEGLSEEDSLLDTPGGDPEGNSTLLSAAKDAVLRMLEQPLEILGTVIKPDGKSSNGDHGNQGNEAPVEHAPEPTPSPPEEATKEDMEQMAVEDPTEELGSIESENGPELISQDTTTHSLETDDSEESTLSSDSQAEGIDKEGSAEVVMETEEMNHQSDKPQLSVDTPSVVEEAVKKDLTCPPISTDSPPISEDIVTNSNETTPPSDEDLLGPTVPPPLGDSLIESKPLGPTKVGEVPPQEGDSPHDMDYLGPTVAPVVEDSLDLMPEPPLPPPATEQSPLTSDESSVPSVPDPTPVPGHTSLSTAASKRATHEAAVDSSSAPSVNGSHSVETTSNGSGSPPPTPPTTLHTSLNTSLNTTNSTGGTKGGKNESDSVTNGNGVPSGTRDKEKSVFLRLSNQIKDLEENVTLLSRYLDQISTGLKRTRNKTEDSTKSLDKRLTTLNDTLQLLRNETELKVRVLDGLSSELQTLTQAVVNITMETVAVDDKILVVLMSIGLQLFLLTPCFILYCFLQYRRHHQLQKNFKTVQSTINLLCQQSMVTQNGGPAHSQPLGHHRANSDLGISCSLPLLHQGEGLAPFTGSDDWNWQVAAGRHRKKNKLKTKQSAIQFS